MEENVSIVLILILVVAKETIFRGNNLFTKAMTCYAIMVGTHYLQVSFFPSPPFTPPYIFYDYLASYIYFYLFIFIFIFIFIYLFFVEHPFSAVASGERVLRNSDV